MMREPPSEYQVYAEHHVAVVRQRAKALSARADMTQSAMYAIATCASELASNLVFHSTQGGTIALSTWTTDDRIVFEMASEDDGPGIPDMELALLDGYTTRGGLGGGLPSLRRMMDEFEITSTVGVGTRIVARKWEQCR